MSLHQRCSSMLSTHGDRPGNMSFQALLHVNNRKDNISIFDVDAELKLDICSDGRISVLH